MRRRDLLDAMSALNIAKTNSLQDQKERENLRSQYSTKAPATEPLTAPVPTRPPVSPPPASVNMWSPEMGIKFGGPAPAPPANANMHHPAYPSTRGGQVRGGQWSPEKGIRFG
jgi:programmed cell death 6-interacting protein